MLLGAVVAGTLFALIALAGLALSAIVCKNIVPFDDGPAPGRPPRIVLIGGGFALGLSVWLGGANATEIAIAAVLDLALVAIWASDVRCGIIPDYFTLVPLAGLVILRVWLRQWDFVISTVVVSLPFALSAALSGGRGMGWGDVKLAALGGATLGSYLALAAFVAGSVIALLVAWMRGRTSAPIAFGPYLSGAIGVALAAGIRGV
ncbi:MAG TPA: A24 family peptidase [Candidatus Baltobacteraceae bacterium]